MTKNLTEGSPAKLIFFFTMPLIAGNIFQQLYADAVHFEFGDAVSATEPFDAEFHGERRKQFIEFHVHTS